MSEIIQELIARKIQENRRRKGLTLAQLSNKADVSVPMLSKIENAKASPPISTYARIAKALEISLGMLFSENGATSISIVTKEERKSYTRSPGYWGEAVAFKKSNKKMEPFVFTYPKGGDHPLPYQHDSEELLFVLEGELEFRYGEEIYVLRTGDTAYFDANIKHSARALGGRSAKALVIQA